MTTKIKITVEELSGSFYNLQSLFLGLLGFIEYEVTGEEGVPACIHQALLASRMLDWSQSSQAFLSCRSKTAECSLALMYPPACCSPKCINSHKVPHSRSLWAGVEALPEVLLQIFTDLLPTLMELTV